MYRLFYSFLLILVIIANLTTLYSCGGGSSGGTGTTAGNSDVVPGPGVGEAGNDADQLFRSLSVDPSDDSVVYVGSEGNGIFKSVDGGSSWQWLRKGLKYGTGSVPNYPEIYDMAIDPADSSVIYAATTAGPGPATGNYPSSIGGVYKSSDGGATWTQISGALPNGAVSSIAISSGTIYIGTFGGVVSFSGTDVDGQHFPGGLFSSSDGGNSWPEFTSLPGLVAGANDASYWQVEVRSSMIFLSAIKSSTTGFNGLLRSNDGGSTWGTIMSAANPVFFSVASNGTTVYASERDTFSCRKSADSGTGWITAAGLPSGPMRVSRVDPFFVLYAQNDRLYRSTDGLATDGALVLPDAGGFIDDVEIGSSGTIYVGARGLIVWKSIDGGASFTRMVNLRDFIDSR